MKIKIEEPCHENWNEMSLREKGRYCHACDKIVLDMTKYSDQEIIDFFKEKKYNVCGQLEEDQVDRKLIPNSELKFSKVKRSLIAASLAGVVFSTNTVSAQNSELIIDQSNKKESDSQEKEEVRLDDETIMFLIKGKIIDIDNRPISGAMIRINTDQVKSKKNGEFELSLGIYETESLEVKAYISANGKRTKVVNLSLDFDKTTVYLGKVQLSKMKYQHVKGKMKVVD